MANRKVVHVVSSLMIGGAERFVIDLSLTQRNMGWDPRILSFGKTDDALVTVCKELALPTVVLNGRRWPWLAELRRLFAAAEIIHVHSPGALRTLSLYLPFVANRTIVYTRHGANFLSERKWKLPHRLARRYIDALTFVSEESSRNFLSTFGWDDKQNHVIENGAVLSSSIAKVGQSGGLRIGMVGRMVPVKRQITILEALTLLSDSQLDRVTVDFFGDGECRPTLEHFRDEKLQLSNIRFHGNVSDRQRIYADMDLLVVTSETEGLSIAILEAMAYGIPVIATNVGGNPRLVLDHITGRLIDYDDPETLAQIIAHLLESPGNLREWGTAARERIGEHFSLQRTAENYEAIYRGCSDG